MEQVNSIMRVVFTGTNAAVPTSKYGTSGVFMQIHGKKLLFDCGEGTQQRMMRFNASINVDAVYLTHFDTDHVLGLPGLVRTMDMNNRDRPLDVFVPDEIVGKTKKLIAGVHGWPSYHINVTGFNEGVVSGYDEFDVKSFSTKHDYVSHGFVIDEGVLEGRLNAEKLQEKYGLTPGEKYGELKQGNSVEASDGTVIDPADVKSEPRSGRKVVYTGDCRSNQNVVENAVNADLLIHEATFHSDDSERAAKTSHSTAEEAAKTAEDADADRLVLTHVSSRYEGNRQSLKEDATNHFEDGHVQVADDGFEVRVSRN